MWVYTLHHPSDAGVPKDDPVQIKEGFNWPAALFASLWALWGGMWRAALLIFVAAVGLQLAPELAGAERSAQLEVGTGLSAIVGFGSSDRRRAKLHRRAYRIQGIVAAPDMGSARRRWFSLRPVS